MARSISPKPASRLPTKVFEGHTDDVWSVAYFHDGKHIIGGSEDKTVRIWDVESQKQEGESLIHESRVTSLALSPDERRLVSGGEGVVVWDLEGRTMMWTKEKVDGMCVAYSPDGRLIAASHYEAIELLSGETGEQFRDPLQFGDGEFIVRSLAFSPDGTRLAVGSGSGKVRVFDVATGETVVRPFKAHSTRPVTSLVYTLDGQQIITAFFDKWIRVWDAATGQEIGAPILGGGRSIWQIALSPDAGRLAGSSHAPTVRVWDLKTRQQIGSPLRARDGGEFCSVSWSPDGRFIVAGLLGGGICLWDVPPHDDHVVIPQAPAPTTSIALPVPSTSQSRANSISSSILNLPAGSQPPNQAPATNRLPDDFFDSSPDLPGHAHNQVSAIPIATVPLRPSIPNTTKAKTGSKTPPASTPSPSNMFGRIGSRFRRDKHAPEAIEMQPPPPKYSPVGKVALGQADKRLYMDESKDKKPQPGDEEQEVLEDIDVNCWEIFCAMIESCFSCCRNSDTQPEPPFHAAPQPPGHVSPQLSGHVAPTSSGHATPTLSGHAAPQSSGRTTPASSHYAMPTSSHHAMTSSSGYLMPTSPGSVAEQLNQNVMWTG